MNSDVEKTLSCTACKNPLTTIQIYCQQCGQKIGKKNITLYSIISDAFINFFSFERSGFATVYKIITTPKFIIQNYCQGNKGFFASPGRMILFLIVILALHLTFISDQILGITSNIQNLNKEYAFFFFNFILFVIVSQLAFINQGFKLARHIVSVIYISTTFLIVFLIFSDLLLLFGIELTTWFLIFYIIFVLFWNSLALTKRKSVWWVLLNFFIQLVILIAIIYPITNNDT